MKMIKVSDLFRKFADLLDNKDKEMVFRISDPGYRKLSSLVTAMDIYCKQYGGIELAPRDAIREGDGRLIHGGGSGGDTG